MNHKTHLYLMGGLLAAGAVLFFWGGAGTGLFLFVWLGACMAMMFFMMRGMGGKGSDASGHSHGADLPKDFEDQSRGR